MSLARELQSGFSALQSAGILGSINTAITAAGSTQAGGTALAAANNIVTTATEGQGVTLPLTMQPADVMEVVNNTSVDIYVYPGLAGKINNSTANVPLMLAPNSGARFFCIDGTSWCVNK